MASKLDILLRTFCTVMKAPETSGTTLDSREDPIAYKRQEAHSSCMWKGRWRASHCRKGLQSCRWLPLSPF